MNTCRDCVYALFKPMHICLSPKVPKVKLHKSIDADTVCFTGDYTSNGEQKRAAQIQAAKDAIKPVCW